MTQNQVSLHGEYLQLVLEGLSGVPDDIAEVEFPLLGGGSYTVIERNGAWDTIFCRARNDTWYMTQTAWRTAQDLHHLRR